jgi:L-2-hydroxyglutarate oxidase LhgO
MPDRSADLVVIGAGIVGLATALQTTRRFPHLRVLVVEKEDHVAAHQTGHNSGVIHSGLYYRTGSLKARNCVAGAESMKRFCQEHGVGYEVCGKLVVATTAEQLQHLNALHQRGIANGLQGLRMMEPEQFREFEPHLTGLRALHVPATGIVDYSEVSRKYAELIAGEGGEIVLGAKVISICPDGPGNIVETTTGNYAARHLVNCAGLYSDTIARMAGAETRLAIVPFRGEYYEIGASGRHLVRGLIYPVPDPRFPFLGVHFTRRISGSIEAGPNAVLAFSREGYTGAPANTAEALQIMMFPGLWKLARRYWRMGVPEQFRSWSKRAFTASLQKMIPEITEQDLAPGGSGVRAQAVDGQGNMLDDFHFSSSHGAIHVCNVPSPAATASLEIGRDVVDRLQECFSVEKKPAAIAVLPLKL